MNATPSRLTLHQWFAAGVAHFSNLTALEVDGAAYTYRQLGETAEAVAEQVVLAHRGIPGRVGLLASRSLLAYAGYLAIQRLMAAAVPLNPRFPAARNRLVADAADLDVVLTEEEHAGQFAAPLERAIPTVVPLSLREPTAVAGAGELPAYRARPDDVAYILFTSGSTGTPKGVPIRHRHVSPYLAAMVARYELGPGCRASQTFDLTFDPSVFDLFVTWAGGGTLVVPRRGELLAPIDWAARQRLTHWFSVPSVVSVARSLGALSESRATTLRYSLFAGEQFTLEQAAAWQRAAPSTVIENLYGPTELTVTCAGYRLPRDQAGWPQTGNGTVPIGRVYEHLQSRVLNGPAGAGELCVRGPQRFDGYLDAADNAGRFLADDGSDPAGPDGRGRLTAEHWYRTGDRVRAEDGELVHLGRLDEQVQVRGYRVELGDIEAAARRHPAIDQAVVVADTGGTDTELVMAHTGAPMSATDLTAWLRERLPMHMVPRQVHHLPDLPRTPNGKVDRARILELVAGSAEPALAGDVAQTDDGDRLGADRRGDRTGARQLEQVPGTEAQPADTSGGPRG